MADTPRLTVLTGTQAGTELEVDLSSGEAVIGSDPTCNVHVDDPAVSPRHALVQASGNEILVQSTDYASEVLVNGNAIAWLTPISEGDEITLGTVKLRFGAEAAAGAAGAADANPFAATADEPPSLGFADEAPVASSSAQPEAEPEEDPDDPPALKLKELDPPKAANPEPEEEPAAPPPPPPKRAPARPSRPSPARRAPTTRSRPARRGSMGRNLAIGVVVLAVIGAAAWFARPFFLSPRLDSVTPARVGVGQTVVLEGQYFGSEPSVLFGETPGTVREASSTRIVAEVPALEMGSGQDLPVSVRVRVGDSDTGVQSLSVYQPPQVTELRPEAAMPGDELLLVGRGWGSEAQVRFDEQTAEVVSVEPTQIRVRVPALEGTSATISVTVGEQNSAPVSFLVGRLPLITSVEPASAAPGDRVTVRGKGFGTTPGEVLAELGSTPALVVSATGDALELIVPPVATGEQELTLRRQALTDVGRTRLEVGAAPRELRFHFVAEPFTLEGSSSRDRALVRSDLGTAFVLAGSDGASAAERAAQAQQRLNAAAQRLASGAAIEVRNAESAPVIGMAGDAQPLLEVTQADAEAHNEAWARSSRSASGPPVTRERLARWWGAVLGDLARILARGEAPSEAAALSADAQVLTRVAAGGRPTRAAVEGRGATREALRTLALRVPASVPGAGAAPVAAAPAGADPAAAAEEFELAGIWTGYEREEGRRHQISITFEGTGGELVYMGASVGFTQQLMSVRRTGSQASFVVRRGGGDRYYQGTWDGNALSGAISSSAGGGGDIGTFELYPKR